MGVRLLCCDLRPPSAFVRRRHLRMLAYAPAEPAREREGSPLYPAIGRISLCRTLERRARAVQEGREACAAPTMSAIIRKIYSRNS